MRGQANESLRQRFALAYGVPSESAESTASWSCKESLCWAVYCVPYSSIVWWYWRCQEEEVSLQPWDCKSDYDKLVILETVIDQPGVFLRELQSKLESTTGTQVDVSTICRFLHATGFTRQKMVVQPFREVRFYAHNTSSTCLYLICWCLLMRLGQTILLITIKCL